MAANPLDVSADLRVPSLLERNRDRNLLTCASAKEADNGVAAAITATANRPDIQTCPGQECCREPLEPLMVCERVDAPPRRVI
jgi:hypothetical protein